MPLPPLLRLPKGKILRTKNAAGARQIFERMPEGCARLDRNDVVVMSPVIMTFEKAPEPVAPPVSKRTFLFDR